MTRPHLALTLLIAATGASACDAGTGGELSAEPLARAAVAAPARHAAPVERSEAPAPEPSKPETKRRVEAPPPSEQRSAQTGGESDDNASTPKPEDKQPAKRSSMKIKRLVVTTGIEGREPVAAGELSVRGGPIIAFIELVNPASEADHIELTFERADGTSVGFVELEVPARSSRWRTWGRTRQISTPGAWSAVVRDRSGNELARQRFDVRS